MVASPKVATYDLKPEMSAGGIASLVTGAIEKRDFDVIVMNFANADMVGHSGKMEPTVKAVEVVSPLQPAYTRVLLSEFRRVGRLTLSGTVVTGLVQGALATIGFWITGVPQATFFGIATALASLVPAIGTLIVWVPAGLYLFLTGHPAAASLELLWGALVVVGTTTVGYLHQGSNWIVCQQKGGDVYNSRGYKNYWFGYTQADNNKWGGASAIEASGGDNYGPFGGGVT